MRKIEFADNKLVVHFTGMTSLAALKKEIEIPFASIQRINTDPFDISAFSFRIGTSGVGKNLREGRFIDHGDWVFLSYENHEKVIVLELNDHEYKKVVLEVENPQEMKEKILRKIDQF